MQEVFDRVPRRGGPLADTLVTAAVDLPHREDLGADDVVDRVPGTVDEGERRLSADSLQCFVERLALTGR